jgi:hypothetical protein
MDAKVTTELVDYVCRSRLFHLIAEGPVMFDERFGSSIKLLTMILQQNPILLAKIASDQMRFYSVFETDIGKDDPEGALEKANALFDLAIVFKHVKGQLAIRNHHAFELLLVCPQSSSEPET